jgi:starvation-inducible outer membrane lipoprotein
MSRLLLVFAAALLVGCTTTPPPLGAQSPASAAAPEGARMPRQTSLQVDAITRRTSTMLSAAQKEQEQWDASGPVSGSADDGSHSAPATDSKHEHP